MNHVELAKALRHGMFADRETLDDAFNFAYMVAKGTDNPAAVMTAVHVVVNTICKELLKETELT